MKSSEIEPSSYSSRSDSSPHSTQQDFADLYNQLRRKNMLGSCERLRRIQEQVEALTGRNQFLSTEQVRADVAEAALSELKEQLEAARKQLQEQYEALKRDAKIKERALTDYFADASRRADDLQEQLETCERDRESLAAGIADWLGSQGYSAAERAELFSSFLASNPAKRPNDG